MLIHARPVALVTGGTKGIGLAIAKQLLEDGFRVVITGTQPDYDLHKDYEADEDVEYIAVNFSNDEQLMKFLNEIERMPPIDVCINNAGLNIINHIHDVEMDDYDFLQKINVRAPFLIAQSVSRKMKDEGFGRIVNIGSIWSVISKLGRVNYCTSKAAIAGMSKSMATDLAPYNILVNCVSPGFVLTDLTKRSLSADEMDTITSQIPVGRMADPTEIAEIVSFLASKKNTYLTGQNIVVDGGFSNV